MKLKRILFLPLFFCLGVAANFAAAQSLVAPGAEMVRLATGMRFTEGPAANSKGDVYFICDPDCKIYRWCVTENKLSVFIEESAHANGTFFDKNDNLYVCEGGTGSVVRYTPDGVRTVVANKFGNRHFNKPNDLWIDPKGGIYFTDPQYGNAFHIVQDGQHVYYILPDRSRVIRVIEVTGVEGEFVKPNGIIGTPDGRLLYVADIDGRVVYRYNIQADGTLTGKHAFATGFAVDGMTIDERGNVYLTQWNLPAPEFDIVVFSAAGEEIERIRVPERAANVTFGGKDFRTLFITAGRSLYAIEMNVKGAR